MKFSATDLSMALGVSYPVASGMLTLLEEINAIKLVAKRTPPGGRGKKVKVFEIPNNLNINFQQIIEARKSFALEKKTGVYTEHSL